MNLDNVRLKEIQELKLGYLDKMKSTDNMIEINIYKQKYDKLTSEELEILKRSDVL